MIPLIVGIIGMSGCGKTYKVAKLIKNQKRVVVFDPTCDPAFDFLFMVEQYETLAESMSHEEFQVVYRPETFDEFDTAFYIMPCFRDYCFVVDEVSFFADSHVIHPALRDIAYMKRRRQQICLLWTSQRPKMVNLALTSQTTVFIAGYLDDSSSLDFLPAQWRSGELSKLRIAEYDGVGEFKIVKGRADVLTKAFGKD